MLYIILSISIGIPAIIILWLCYDCKKFKKSNRNLPILLLLLGASSMQSHAQYKDNNNCIVFFLSHPNQPKTLTCIQEEISYSFVPNSNFWEVKIGNLRDEAVRIYWENAQIVINGKVFDLRTQEQSLIEEEVPTGKESQQRLRLFNYEGNELKMYQPKQIKKGEATYVSITLPIAGEKCPFHHHTFRFCISGNKYLFQKHTLKQLQQAIY
ncbi:MAG: hypothetical protein E7099_06795 [Mediterranea massiliensis]|nr:hypothetical protein [Mediterranea massiliensis]